MASRRGKWRKVYKPCTDDKHGKNNPHNHTTYIQRPVKRKK